MILAAFEELSATEYGIVGIVLVALFGMLQKQIQFSNRLASDHAKQREQDLDKISAALIIIKESQDQQSKACEEAQKQQVRMCEKVIESAQKIAENQGLMAKDMETMKQLAISHVRGDIKQS